MLEMLKWKLIVAGRCSVHSQSCKFIFAFTLGNSMLKLVSLEFMYEGQQACFFSNAYLKGNSFYINFQ